jgi:mutual gliding-motility protein MglA
MAAINFALRRVVAEIVYCGPSMSGKTTTLEQIASQLPGTRLMKPEPSARTVLFDLLPLRSPLSGGWTMQYNVKSLPGQVEDVAVRRQGLLDPDAVVFVADSLRGRADANAVAMDELRTVLETNGRRIDEVPLVLQYNKRDLPHILGVDDLQALLNPEDGPAFGSIAHERRGILPPLGAALALAKARALARLGPDHLG